MRSIAITGCIFVFCLSNQCLAQKEIRNAIVTKEDLQLGTFKPDTLADAVILFDKGETTVDYSGTKIQYHRRIKIINRQGIDKWGRVFVYAPRSAVSKIEGLVFNLENGEILKSALDIDFVFNERYNKNTDKLSCVFPNVREGSIIDYKYSVKYWNAIIPNWYFQHSIPVLISDYKVYYPVSNGLSTTLQGIFPYSLEQKDNDGKEYHWMISNLPAFQIEPFMPYQEQYRSSIRFWNYNESWNSIYRQLKNDEDFWGVVTKNYHLKSEVNQLIKGIVRPTDKIKVLANFVKNSIEWNKVSDFYGIRPSELLEGKRGTSGDINLLLGSLLLKAGFDVSMVLISTKDHGFVIEDLPSLRQFNYVVCHVNLNGVDLFVDAVNNHLPYDVLPERCANVKGFKVGENRFEWITTPSNFLRKTSGNADLLIVGDTLTGKMSFSHFAYASAEERELLVSKSKISLVKHLGGNVETKKYELINPEDADLPLSINLDVLITNCVNRNNNRIYLNPLLIHRLESNPFVEKNRSYPIDFGVRIEETLVLTIEIPDGYVVEEMPPSKMLSVLNQGIKYSVNFSKIENKLIVTSSYKLSQTTYRPEQYSYLKEFYASMIALQARQIVLKK